MAQLRWGAASPRDSESARERLVDAAEACFERFGVAKTTIEDVASAANVSRATVYRYFATRDELILGVILREASRFLKRLHRRIENAPGLEQAIVEGVVFIIKAVRADQRLALLFVPDAAGLTTSIAGASEALFTLAGEFLRPLFESAQASGELRAGIDLDDATEWVMRVMLSLLSVEGPVQRGDAATRRFLQTFLVPSLVSQPSRAPAANGSPRRRRSPTTGRHRAGRSTRR